MAKDTKGHGSNKRSSSTIKSGVYKSSGKSKRPFMVEKVKSNAATLARQRKGGFIGT